MQASGSSPPFIIDSDMSGDFAADYLYQFDSSRAESPGVFFGDESATDTPVQYLNFGTPKSPSHKSPLPDQKPLLETRQPSSSSTPSTSSPTGSFQDSSSASSRYHRKSSSGSARSFLTSGDIMMADDADMGDWKGDNMMADDGLRFGVDGMMNPPVNQEYNDMLDMEQMFDFNSATNSPHGSSPDGAVPVDMESPEMPTIKYDTPGKDTPTLKKVKNHNKATSQNSITQSMHGFAISGSREVSPLASTGMLLSHESSPLYNNSNSPSPDAGLGYMNAQMFNNPQPSLSFTHGIPNMGMQSMPQGYNGFQPNAMPGVAPGPGLHNPNISKPTLILHPTPLKSRVETQIPIKLTLDPLPLGIRKLHLPTHTISKPKLMAKPRPDRSPDTLELYTALLCTSAMQNPEALRRAFERAANPGSASEGNSPDSGSDEDGDSKPLNGGDVKICVGCITRERKRAARKKVKKAEEEDSWHQYEAQRVIVFNTHEIKEWQTPTPQPPSDAIPDRAEPVFYEGAMQVDAPMRIACYCRHQNEKHGFRVLFTIKDYQDRVVAQQITNSIMITDDHKTHNMPTLPTENSNTSDSQLYNGSGSFPADNAFDMPQGPVGGVAPFRMSHSSSDLHNMQKNSFNFHFQPSMSTGPPIQTTSNTMTPRNLSRQTSPSASTGPNAKKRKASGSGKIPNDLAMTRLEGEYQNSMSQNPSTVVSPMTPTLTAFPSAPAQQFAHSSTAIPSVPQQYNTGPPTPINNDQLFFSNTNRSHSMENLARQPIYSTPNTTHPSRVPSPTGLSNNMQGVQQHQQVQQAQVAQAIANGLYGIPLALNPHRPPLIHKLIPNEGPTAGGIEVTCLGSGFFQGLEVMFGDAQATTTTYWGETSLVCLLPPSSLAGNVPVTFKHERHQPYVTSPAVPKQQVFFKYVADDEQQLLKTALLILNNKLSGKSEDIADLVRKLMTDGAASSAGQSPTGGTQHPQVSGFSAASFGVDLEATILKCFDLIDLDDSPYMPRFNMRRPSGQTMLHLACSLGLTRVVAALLARGANPEPRDRGGFTPMHFAALHNHPQIIRRLMLGGADPTIRSTQGYTPSDMTTSVEVARAARRIEHHSRTRSGTSLKSRTNSATSLRSVWQLSSRPAPPREDSSDDNDDGPDDSDDDADATNDEAFYMKSRCSSAVQRSAQHATDEDVLVHELPSIRPAGDMPSPTAAMSAIRDQITAQIQQIQQTMHLNLPNFPQMPQFNIANLPDYQAYIPTTPMVRRISNLVGHNRPDSPKEQDYKWWEFFSGTAPAAPPSYEEIFPQGDVDSKRASAAQAAADTVADNKCAELFDQQVETSSSAQKRPVVLNTVRIGQKHVITKEQQDQLRLAHAEKVKRLSRDRNLFFIWIPLLIIIILAMLYNRVPQVWTSVSQFIESVRTPQGQSEARFIEV